MRLVPVAGTIAAASDVFHKGCKINGLYIVANAPSMNSHECVVFDTYDAALNFLMKAELPKWKFVKEDGKVGQRSCFYWIEESDAEILKKMESNKDRNLAMKLLINNNAAMCHR